MMRTGFECGQLHFYLVPLVGVGALDHGELAGLGPLLSVGGVAHGVVVVRNVVGSNEEVQLAGLLCLGEVQEEVVGQAAALGGELGVRRGDEEAVADVARDLVVTRRDGALCSVVGVGDGCELLAADIAAVDGLSAFFHLGNDEACIVERDALFAVVRLGRRRDDHVVGLKLVEVPHGYIVNLLEDGADVHVFLTHGDLDAGLHLAGAPALEGVQRAVGVDGQSDLVAALVDVLQGERC